MNRGGSPGRSTVLAGDSARLQEEVSRRMSGEKTGKTEKMSPEDVLKKRLEGGRSPLSGVAQVVQDLGDEPKLPPDPDDLLVDKDPNEVLLSSQRINARILEAWINNTIFDAEHLEIPAALAKGEQQHPLSRFGVDRHSLARAGVSNADINRIYKALFVYSLGFYQLINKTMEHIDGKYTYIAGVWKVYSILLEYCCKVDYNMAISTVQEEMRVALEKCEAGYKAQLEAVQEKCEKAMMELETHANKVGLLEHELQLEKHKREDMEEELAHRGTGQEEEVELRIKFESKLNQMFAQQRDMETRQKQHLKTIETLQRTVEEKTDIGKDLTGKVNALTEAKIALEGQVIALEERLIHTQRMNNTLENRISDNIQKIEGLKEEYTETKEKLQVTQSQLLQRNLIVDKLESEKTAIESQLLKVQAVVDGYQRERDQALSRVATLEVSMKTDIARFLDMEQEYVRIKADEGAKDKLITNFRSISERVSDELQRSTAQLDSLKIQYENQTVLNDQLKDQLKKAVSTIDEVTRGRKLTEDRIEELQQKLSDLSIQKEEIFLEYSNAKKEVDKAKIQIVELEQEIDSVEMRRRSYERQFDGQKETLLQKIKNLSDILNAERKVRENWIEKFEVEQKANSDSMREAMEFRRGMSDLQMQLHTANSRKEEALKRLEAERNNSLEARKLTSDLRHKLEESERKSYTLTRLMESQESEWNAKLSRTETRCQSEISAAQSQLFIEQMVAEDYRSTAFHHFSSISDLTGCISTLRRDVNRSQMRCEDLHIRLISTTNLAKMGQEREAKLQQEIVKMGEKLHSKEAEIIEKSLENQRINALTQSLRSKIPEEFLDQPHPFETLQRKIRDLEATIEANNQLLLSRSDKEISVDITAETAENSSQTDITSAFFESIRPKSRSSGPGSKPGTPMSRAGMKGNIVLDDSTLTIMEKGRKGTSGASSRSRGVRNSPRSDASKTSRAFEIGSKQGKREVDDSAPFVMKSVYKHDSSPMAGGNKSVSGVSGISGDETTPIARSTNSGSIRKLPQIYTAKGPPPEIKSFIRAAVSRRKDDFDD